MVVRVELGPDLDQLAHKVGVAALDRRVQQGVAAAVGRGAARAPAKGDDQLQLRRYERGDEEMEEERRWERRGHVNERR